MTFNKEILQRLAARVDAADYVRIVRRAFRNTPLGTGYGKTRFSSPTDAFKILYLAQDARTAIAETIIRDRYQGKAKRELLEEEFDDYSIVAIKNGDPLTRIDLRHEGANLLGVPTETARARAQLLGRKLSQQLYDHTALDGIA
jgi:RES domain